MIINDLFTTKKSTLAEFATGGGSDPGDYFKVLADAWYNGSFDSGSLQKGIKSQEDVERLLARGVVCPDGKTRKFEIGYNSDFDGVVISSDDYYEHSDYNDQGQEVDSRTGQPWGPYDYMEFKDEELDEGMTEASLGDYRKKAAVSQAGAKIDRFFGRDDPAKVAAADQTIAKRERGLARADARIKPYTPPPHDAEKYQRELTAKYPNIDELVAKAERNRDPNYEYAEGPAYYRGREAEHEYKRLKQIQRVIQGLNEATQPKTNTAQLNEMMLLEDPVYKSWRKIGTVLVERKLSRKEILQVFADAESGMTDRSTGANRTMLGRGKDVTVDFAKDISGAVSGILDSIQKSVPVSAVDVAYDQATDALGRVAGGQKGKVMQAIKTYRNLVKQYPKTAGFAKAALVAIAGLATSGAGLPAIAGLTYALDSAIRGDKLSSVLGKGAGAYALTAAAQGIASGASQSGTADTSAFTDVNQMGDYTGPTGGLDDGGAVTGGAPLAPPVDLQTYTVQSGDTLSDIAQRFNTTVRELQGLNPQLASAQPAVGGQMPNPDVIFPGQQLTLPAPTGDSVYAGGVGTSANTMSQIQRGNIPDSAISQRMAQRESIRYRTLPLSEIVDRDATAREWALNESRTNPRQRPVVLNTLGAYTVFENVDRYRKFVLEKAGEPGSTRPAYYRPDMPGGPGKKSKPGIIGRGLNWLDQKAKAVGGAISNFGHQFTTDVTKEKLKMNWHQDGEPSDSDKLAAWLVTQGVPQQVVTDVYAKMKIPYTAPAAAPGQANAPTDQTSTPTDQTQPATAEPSYKQVGTGTGRINPATGRAWTPAELKAKYPYDPEKEARKAELERSKQQAKQELEVEKIKQSLGDPRDSTSQIAKSFMAKGGLGAVPKSTPRPTTPSSVPNVAGFNAGSLAQQPGMSQYMQPQAGAKPTAASFAQGPSGYKTTTMNVLPAASTNTAPATTTTQPQTITIGGQKIKPNDPAYAKIMKNAPPVQESLSWSKNFNPGMTLYRRMKHES